MARSTRDNLKRSMAQAINHLAQAILDVHEIYLLFKEPKPDEAAYLEQCMMGINQIRDALLSFALAAWALDEERLKSYF